MDVPCMKCGLPWWSPRSRLPSRVPLTLPGVPGPPVATTCQVFPRPPSSATLPRAVPPPLTPSRALAY